MSSLAATARQQREVEFYRQYARRQRVDRIDFEPVEGRQQRPWNPYWYVYQVAASRFTGPSQRMLDFGCGIGIAALRFAHLGYQVDGFDLSEDNLTIARDLARQHQLTDRCTFTPMLAEQLHYKDASFDLIAGIDILHHVEIPKAIAEARRVLKPGGVAIFKEHVEVPLVDYVRNSSLVRAIAPQDVSLDNHITEDERKLNRADLALIENSFERVDTKRFTVVSRLDRLIGQTSDKIRGRLQRLDRRLMQLCPPLKQLGGTVVLTCHKAA